ncbi:DUF6787 family protein [Pseudochryseolinea flava]|uniref:Prolipoprotein diacylglyceryl transferase n=1 Tax=Pseudochryseolinea flava TaxID=2059302 RepID=A0A364YBG8_9BACT|nr:DUF6787 family protein [Pseudochryseolinea flava]RAW03422.1 prolipoprotein diacylglyceryl transferase [Pseudochryseolinea flava]
MLWTEKLKTRWNLKSGWQLLLILIVFACTGLSAMFIKKPVMNFLTDGNASNWKASMIYYIFLMTPLYNVLLLGYGFIFGQFNFFWEFEKKMFRRIFRRSAKNQEPVK